MCFLCIELFFYSELHVYYIKLNAGSFRPDLVVLAWIGIYVLNAKMIILQNVGPAHLTLTVCA